MIKRSSYLILLVSLVTLGVAYGQVRTLTFEGLQQDEQILNYYNGGTGSLGSGPGPSWGITFGTSALALISGNFENNPTPPTITYFTSGPGVVMNVPAGFTTGFSFYYAAASNPGTVTVYDGLDGTGNLLATIDLPVTGANCGGSTASFSCWSPIGASFIGTAKSVSFGGVANQIGFDNITVGAAAPEGVPAPASLLLVLAGMGSAGLYAARKRLARR
jgi:hypothetical protein